MSSMMIFGQQVSGGHCHLLLSVALATSKQHIRDYASLSPEYLLSYEEWLSSVSKEQASPVAATP